VLSIGPIVQSGAQLNQISVEDFMEDPGTPKVFYHYFNTLTFCLVVHSVQYILELIEDCTFSFIC
jgi:hypothetical protein